MGRPPKYPWKRIFGDLEQGDTQEAVCARYAVPESTLRDKLRRTRKSRPQSPSSSPSRSSGQSTRVSTPPKPSLSLVTRPTRHTPTAAPRETAEERGRRMARERQAERQQQTLNALSPIDRQSLRRVVRRQVQMLDTGMRCPKCDPGEGGLEIREIRDLTVALNSTMKTLPGLMQVEDELEPEQETGPDLSTAEGQAQLAAFLNGQPHLMALCDVEVLEAALKRARARQRRQA